MKRFNYKSREESKKDYNTEEDLQLCISDFEETDYEYKTKASKARLAWSEFRGTHIISSPPPFFHEISFQIHI